MWGFYRMRAFLKGNNDSRMLPIIHIKFQRVWNLNLPLLLLIGLLATLKDNETNSQISLRSEVQVCLVGPRNILLLAKTTIDQVFDSGWMTIGSWEWRVVGKDRGPQPKKHDRWDRHCAMQKSYVDVSQHCGSQVHSVKDTLTSRIGQ